MKYYTSYSISKDKLPVNKPIWALAYSINDDTEHKRLICKPVQGEIRENTNTKRWCSHIFYPYKKGTTEIRKSGSVDYYSRMYADTYEEAIEMFNELVQTRIDNLNRMAREAEKDMI